MKNKKMKRVFEFSVSMITVSICLFTFGVVGFAENKCVSSYTETSQNWTKYEEKDYIFWVAYKRTVDRACRLNVYLDEAAFNPIILRRIGQQLANEFKELPVTVVYFSTSRNQTLGNILGMRLGRSFEELPEKEYKRIAIEDKPNTKWYNAIYIGGLEHSVEKLMYDDVTCTNTTKLLKKVYKENGIVLMENEK